MFDSSIIIFRMTIKVDCLKRTEFALFQQPNLIQSTFRLLYAFRKIMIQVFKLDFDTQR